MKTRGKNWHRNQTIKRTRQRNHMTLSLWEMVDARQGWLINHLQNRLRQANRKYATLHREVKKMDDERSRLYREIERLRTCLLDTQEILKGKDPRPVEGVTRRL